MQYMNPYAQSMLGGAQMTEEEKLRRYLQATQGAPQGAPQGAGQGMPQGMPQGVNQLASQADFMAANQDLAPQEAAFDRQIAFAQAMRGRAMPEGQRVGPSGIYVENQFKNAAAAAERALGGFVEGRLQGRQDETMGPLRQAKAEAEARVARGNAQQGVGQFNATQEQQAGQFNATQAQQADQFTNNQAQEQNQFTTRIAADQELAAQRAREERDLVGMRGDEQRATDAANVAREVTQFSAINSDTGVPGMYYQRGEKVFRGTPAADESNLMTPAEVYKLTELGNDPQGVATVASSAAQLKARRKLWEDTAALENETVALTSNISRLANDPELPESMGRLNVPAALGRELGLGEGAWKDQTRDQRARAVALSFYADTMRLFAPVTDRDFSEIKASVAQITSEPQTMYAFLYGQGMDSIAAKGREQRALITAGGEVSAQDYDQKSAQQQKVIRGSLLNAAFKAGVKKEDLAAFGLRPEDAELARVLWDY